MNRKMVFSTVGRILLIEAALLLLPIAVSLIYGEFGTTLSFLATASIAACLGFALSVFFRGHDRVIFAREGFVTVALAWIFMSAVGALPFVFSGAIPNYVDAFFETVSGFTTTGASILNNIEILSHGILFWRSFTHWIGGMGVLVFIMAIFPSESGRDIHIMRAEMPGPIIGKLVPKVRDTAKLLYLIYVVMTAIQIVMLLFGGMPLFDSIVHTFGTAGTGGFGIRNDSIASYSPYCQWVITVFMLLFGLNFNLYYLLLIRRVRAVFKSRELWCYLSIVAVSVTAICINISRLYGSFSEALRSSCFQVASIITTTGYATADFNAWPELSKTILVALMFIGGCAGSTAGGLKVSRIILLFKTVRRDLRHLIHPRSVETVQFEGKKIDDRTLSGVNSYLTVYCIIFFSVLLALSALDSFDFTTNFTAVSACFNNVGPGLGAVGPTGNYYGYSAVSKLLLSVAMLLGRLEIFPLLLTLSPSTWTKK